MGAPDVHFQMICLLYVCYITGNLSHIHCKQPGSSFLAVIHRFLRNSKTISILTVPNLKIQKNKKFLLGAWVHNYKVHR